MKRLCSGLAAAGFDLAEKDALEVFGRKGDWHTIDYAKMVRSIEVWEIDPQHNADLEKNLPGATIKNVDSIIFAADPANRERFDFVVIDNPQALFGPDDAYCEHFDIIGPAAAVLKPDGVIVFNVNIQPYDYDLHLEWRTRRERFYGRSDTESIELSELIDFYTALFNSHRKEVVLSRYYRRNEFLYYLVYRLISSE